MAGTPQAKIDEALEYLVSNVYNKLDNYKNADSDEDIYKILDGREDDGA